MGCTMCCPERRSSIGAPPPSLMQKCMNDRVQTYSSFVMLCIFKYSDLAMIPGQQRYACNVEQMAVKIATIPLFDELRQLECAA